MRKMFKHGTWDRGRELILFRLGPQAWKASFKDKEYKFKGQAIVHC